MDGTGSLVLSDVRVLGIRKRRSPSKHYVYIICVQRSDGMKYFVLRRFSQLFELQSQLMELIAGEDTSFDSEEGQSLPALPERIVFGRSHVRKVAEKRCQQIERFCQDLIRLPLTYSLSATVEKFFNLTDDDIYFWTLPAMDSEDHFSAKEISFPLEMEKYFVTHEYEAHSDNELSVAVGCVILLIKKTDIGWWYVQGSSRRGWVPSAYLRPPGGATDIADSVTTLLDENNVDINQRDELYIAKKCYTPSPSCGKRQDELLLVRGMIVNILVKNDDGWWLAHCTDGRVGLVPGSCLAPVNMVKALDLARFLPEICTPCLVSCQGDSYGDQPVNCCQLNFIQGNAHFTKPDQT